jgi:SAM-dependent methyltransferase
MTASSKYYQEKQLPATPRLNTQDAVTKLLGASSSESASARTPSSATTFPDRRMPQHAIMHPDAAVGLGAKSGGGFPRAESISSVSGATTTSNRTVFSSEQQSSLEASAYHSRPFVVRNGRTYISDATLPYPLPVDLEEIHHQSLKTMLLMQLYGRPICAPAFADKPPPRILEIGCATGFWSMMCYKHYEARGQHTNISFTGIDIVPLAPSLGPGASQSSAEASPGDTRPDTGMNWRFVQHDLRKLPLPFPDSSFDLVMVKDMGLAITMTMQQGVVEEYIRVLSPGGTLEIWETDHVLRMLRPHVPEQQPQPPPSAASTPTTLTSGAHFASVEDGPEDDPASPYTDDHNNNKQPDLGAYVLTSHTPLSTPLNNFLVEYNLWIQRALELRALAAVPCTLIAPLLMQEAEVLTKIGSRRLAVPLSEIRWEREGVGGVVTKDGKSYIETGKLAARHRSSDVAGGGGKGGGGGLDAGAAALRRTALMSVVGQIQSLEPILREVSGKSQDEWDTWMGKMMSDLVRENGTSWGECLEVGAWWARKR